MNKHLCIYKLILFKLLISSTILYSQNNDTLKKIEIYSIGKIDTSLTIIDHNSITKIENNEYYTLDVNYVENFFKYVNSFFINKEKKIYDTYEISDGYMYSHNEKLKIVVYYDYNKCEEFIIELSKNGIRIKTTDEFKDFLKLLYGGYKIKWNKIEHFNGR